MKPGKPLQRRTALKRTGGLRQRTPLRAKRRRPVTDRAMAEAWAAGARRPCVVCGDPDVEIHHVITQEQLRVVARSRGLDLEPLRWDHRNALAVCEKHHAAHHARRERLPRLLLERWCPGVFAMADELGLTPWLERTYPQ